MIDERQVFERVMSGFVPPDDSLERLVRRRDRKRRNQRIAAGVVGIAVFVAAIWIVTSVGSFDRTQTPAGEGTTGPTETGPMETGPTVTEPTYSGPTYALGRVTPKDIALGHSLMAAWVDGDGEAVAAVFSPEGTFDGFQPGILPELHDWFRAEGWTFGSSDCGIHGWGPMRGVVGCTFTYENDLTRALGMLPMDTTLSFVTDADGIETAWFGAGGDVVFDMFTGFRGHPTNDVFGPIWDTFIDWIASRHPDDFGRMYDSDRGYPILDPLPTELWKRYTAEFVASPQAQALARSIHDAGWDGVGFPPEGTAPSTPVEGELVAHYDATLGPDYAFVYADGRVISGDSIGNPMEQRLTPEGVDLVRSGAVEPERFADGVAASWVDPEIRPYVPSRYAVCFYQESGDANPGTINGGYEYPSRVVGFFPARARDILLSATTRTYRGSADPVECSEVTTDEARAFDAILRDVKVEDAEGDVIAFEINTLLPHGEWVGTGG